MDLPLRDGIDASRTRLPAGTWTTVLEYLEHRFPLQRDRLADKFAAGDFFDDTGAALTADSRYRAGDFIRFHRDPPVESRVPFELVVLHRDERVLVVDKPHFLASTPRGMHVAETALVRLRRQLELPELAPAHRLDRLTAGLLLFTVDRRYRGAYQMLFANRLVHKSYAAVAGVDAGLRFPLTVRSRIVKERGRLQSVEVDGPINAETVVEQVAEADGVGGYRLTPHTGKTHQLRVHMSRLGLPIHGDHFYPEFHDVPDTDYANPLQLLAHRLEFTDPVNGERLRFVSSLRLTGWPQGQPAS